MRQGGQHAVFGGDADDGGAHAAVPVGGGVHLQRPHRQREGADAVHRIRGEIIVCSWFGKHFDFLVSQVSRYLESFSSLDALGRCPKVNR